MLSLKALRIWLGVSVVVLLLGFVLVIVSYTSDEPANVLNQITTWAVLVSAALNVWNFSHTLRRKRREKNNS